jgi:glutamine synthetase
MREEGGLTEIEKAIDKLSRHHIRHIKAYDPKEGKANINIIFGTVNVATLMVNANCW